MKKQDKKRRKTRKLPILLTFGLGREKDYFIENLAILLASSMSILSALEAIKQETRTRRMRKVIDYLREEIETGSPLWRALENARLASANTISLIHVGEETGRIAENLKVISLQKQKERNFNSKIHSAMIYPILIFSLTLVIGIGIAWFILPRLSDVFLQLDVELPAITKALIAFGNFLGEHGIIFIPSFVFSLFVIIYFIFFFSKTKTIGQWLLLKTPGVKRLIKEVELARFGYVFGNLLEAGLPIVDSLDSLSDAALFDSYKKLYIHLRDHVEEGNSFHKSFKLYRRSKKLIPPTIQQMIAAGEQSGDLSGTLIKIGEIFEEKTEVTSKNLTVLLEPALLIFVWLGVVFIALAIIMPIYSLIGGLQSDSTTTEGPKKEIVDEGVGLPLIDDTLSKLEITYKEDIDIHEKPSSESTIIGTAESGETYNFSDQKNGWYEITFTDRNDTGWVTERFIEPVE